MTWTFGANENGSFTLPSGSFTVRYGAGSTYITKVMSGKVLCSNATFTDPLKGTYKHCDYQPITDLQAALNGTPKGGTLDASTQTFAMGQLTVPAFVTLKTTLVYTGNVAAQQSDFIDLAEGAVFIGTIRSAP